MIQLFLFSIMMSRPCTPAEEERRSLAVAAVRRTPRPDLEDRPAGVPLGLAALRLWALDRENVSSLLFHSSLSLDSACLLRTDYLLFSGLFHGDGKWRNGASSVGPHRGSADRTPWASGPDGWHRKVPVVLVENPSPER